MKSGGSMNLIELNGRDISCGVKSNALWKS
jgi:hypothetical protein